MPAFVFGAGVDAESWVPPVNSRWLHRRAPCMGGLRVEGQGLRPSAAGPGLRAACPVGVGAAGGPLPRRPALGLHRGAQTALCWGLCPEKGPAGGMGRPCLSQGSPCRQRSVYQHGLVELQVTWTDGRTQARLKDCRALHPSPAQRPAPRGPLSECV